MADSSLDDFFAKKDKSKKGKKKDKSKFTASDILAKQTEEPKKEKKKLKEKTTEKKDENTEKKVVQDEEWNDYEDEDTDYSGLRIQTLQISSKEEREEGGENAEGEEGEEGTKGDGEGKSDGSQGIWSGKPPATASVAAPAPEPEPEPPKPAPEPEAPKTGGKYVPPGARAAAAAAAASGDSPGGPTIPSHIRRKMKAAPNIMSEMDFPTLGGGGPGDNRSSPESSGARFERVNRGGKYAEDTSSKGAPKLSLGNKFDALSGGAD